MAIFGTPLADRFFFLVLSPFPSSLKKAFYIIRHYLFYICGILLSIKVVYLEKIFSTLFWGTGCYPLQVAAKDAGGSFKCGFSLTACWDEEQNKSVNIIKIDYSAKCKEVHARNSPKVAWNWQRRHTPVFTLLLYYDLPGFMHQPRVLICMLRAAPLPCPTALQRKQQVFLVK